MLIAWKARLAHESVVAGSAGRSIGVKVGREDHGRAKLLQCQEWPPQRAVVVVGGPGEEIAADHLRLLASAVALRVRRRDIAMIRPVVEQGDARRRK